MIDPRIEFLKDHTCDEFLGPNPEVKEEREDDIVSGFPIEASNGVPPFPIGFLGDKAGFQLLGRGHEHEPNLHIIQETPEGPRIAGYYLGETFGVLPEFWDQRGLGRELVLAAFYQCHWKNKKQCYTRRGLNSFKRAHRYIVHVATELGIRNQDLAPCTCAPEYPPRLPEEAVCAP